MSQIGARTIPMKCRSLDPVAVRRIAKLREVGMTWTDIARRWGIGTEAIVTIAKKAEQEALCPSSRFS